MKPKLNIDIDLLIYSFLLAYVPSNEIYNIIDWTYLELLAERKDNNMDIMGLKAIKAIICKKDE